ncbi:MAG: hypothetical protein ACRENI_03010 [Gemmatimonadaceae bacterium]
MHFLKSKTHGVLDLLTVVAFAAAPSIVGFAGLPATICYALAAIHLVLTLGTAFPLGVVKVVPLYMHGMIELAVGALLLVVPWLLGFADLLLARNFYIAAGLVILIVWFFSDYRADAGGHSVGQQPHR